MKTFLSVCLLLVSTLCYGQNWRPFKTGQVHGYAFTPGYETFLNKAIVTVSVQAPRVLAPGDTVWPFNRALMPADPARCHSPAPLKVRPFGPFGSEIRHNAAGALFYIWDSAANRVDSLLLTAQLPAGQVYTSGSHALQYVGTDFQSIAHGLSDSVRTYRLDTSTIRWSKEYGIVQMPVLIRTQGGSWGINDYLTTGQPLVASLLTGAFGLPLPTAETLYPYQAGDTLGYSTTGYAWSFMGGLNLRVLVVERDRRRVVRTRTVDPTARILRISYTQWERTHHLAWGGGTRDTVIFSGPSLVEEAYSLDARYQTGYADSVNNDYLALVFEDIGTDTVLGITKAVGIVGSERENCFEPVVDGGGVEVLVPGLGFFSGSYPNGETQLTCWRINGQGILCQNILAALPHYLNNDLRLAQNPVITQLEVLSPIPLHLTLQDLQGRTVVEVSNSKTLSTQTLSPGLYVLKAQDQQGGGSVLRVMKQ